jgi:predicted small metal-binding protein
MARKIMDCRQTPSEKNCTLTIAGEEDEVLRVAVMHAVADHGHKDTPEFRAELRGALKPEGAEGASARR